MPLAPHTPLTLFIIKRFYDYEHYKVANGLRNSAGFVVAMLLSEGHRAKLVEAVDGNSIDALVTQNQPTKVVIEAIWVTPTKMSELQKLHPSIKWTVRVHSEIPFLANEGMSIQWLYEYLSQGVAVAFNSAQTVEDFNVLGSAAYLPNYYPLRKPRASRPEGKTIDVGCFGAVRPLKNQLIQAFAAVRYARIKNKPLVFHMNETRQEQGGNNNLKNIAALLKNAGATLQLHPWYEHGEFLEVIGSMDICLQVSMSESFNIVSADAVSMGVPLVGSEAISWLPKLSQADVNSAESITNAMLRASKITTAINTHALESYLHTVVKTWNTWVNK